MSTAPSQRVASGRYLWDMAALRDAGGDVIPRSVAGAPTRPGPRLPTRAPACRSLDMDVEGRPLTNTAGISATAAAVRAMAPPTPAPGSFRTAGTSATPQSHSPDRAAAIDW